jgi:hypothetical protein
VCAALSNFDFSSEDSSSSKEDEKPKCKKSDFTGLCLMGKFSRNASDSDSDVSDVLSFESLSLRVAKLEIALCNQDKLLYKVFHENKKLNLELESSFIEISSLQSVHDDMSVKPCDNYKMIMVNYADLWIVHSQVASLLDGTKLELREHKARSLLLGACTSRPLLRSDLEACVVEIKDLKHQIDHSSRYSILSPPCEMCDSLKGKLFYATKENTELKQEVAYLTSLLERTIVSEKMIEHELGRVEESATKFTYKLSVGFERCKDKGEKRAPKFIPTSNYHKEKEIIKSTKTHYPSSPKPSFNHKREVRKESPSQERKPLFAYFLTVLVTWMSFASVTRELRRCALIMIETHIMMSSLIFCLILILVLCITLFMDLAIAHMVLVHEKIVLCLDTLVTAHVLIVVIVSHICLIFLLEGLTLTLSPDTWMVYVFPVVVHVPLVQMVKCKGL